MKIFNAFYGYMHEMVLCVDFHIQKKTYSPYQKTIAGVTVPASDPKD